jgi:hypothetical protein
VLGCIASKAGAATSSRPACTTVPTKPTTLCHGMQTHHQGRTRINPSLL